MDEEYAIDIESKLTPKHWALYRFIEKRTLDTEDKIPQREIYEYMLNEGYDVTWKDDQNQHNDHCRWLWSLVQEINFSSEVDHIIVHDRDYNYCLGSANETLKLWHHFYERSETAKKRHARLLAKIKRNGQGKLLSNQGQPIDEHSLAKAFHETFNSKGHKPKEAKA